VGSICFRDGELQIKNKCVKIINLLKFWFTAMRLCPSRNVYRHPQWCSQGHKKFMSFTDAW
jgi:hypothetical protein